MTDATADSGPALGWTRWRGLSARLLVLTLVFVMLAEVLIYAPSIGRFRKVWLEDRVHEAYLAALTLEAAPDGALAPATRGRILDHVMALGIMVEAADGRMAALTPDMPRRADHVVDLRHQGAGDYILDAFAALWRADGRVLRVIGHAAAGDGTMPLVEVLTPEAPLRAAMIAYSERILLLSLFISAMTAVLVFVSLHWLMVRPMRRLTASILAFREAPEDAVRIIRPGGRRDEVGAAERALAEMQHDLRAALVQRARLAALGTAVTKIHHDLRSILSSAVVVSERLEASDDPEVRRNAPLLVKAIDRAAALCTQTVNYVREGPPLVSPARVALAAVVDEARAAVAGFDGGGPAWRNEVDPALAAVADRTLLFRVLANLARNAAEAGAGRITFRAAADAGRVALTVADDGPGLPPRVREALFVPFSPARPGGTGLGLAIARELMAAQGGQIALEHSGAEGTAFRLVLPAAMPTA